LSLSERQAEVFDKVRQVPDVEGNGVKVSQGVEVLVTEQMFAAVTHRPKGQLVTTAPFSG
jgi:hypothetical protein